MLECVCVYCWCVCVSVCETYVHDAVLVGVEEQPIIEERQLGVGGRHVGLQTHRRDGSERSAGSEVNGVSKVTPLPSYRAGGEQPANDGPAGQDVGAQHLIGRVHHAADVADEVATQ